MVDTHKAKVISKRTTSLQVDYTKVMTDIVLILHNIRSTHNVGSLFRTADAAGVSKIMLTGYTPTPLDRFGRQRKDIAKVSLGAESSIPWEQMADVHAAIHTLREKGYVVAAVEQDERAVSYTTYSSDQPTALILGNEVDGMPHEVLAECDVVLEIPQYGTKESLNVSVAGGIVLFGLRASMDAR
jgi:tRNA G18 (ribose-2'-O)-methylase SpoU